MEETKSRYDKLKEEGYKILCDKFDLNEESLQARYQLFVDSSQKPRLDKLSIFLEDYILFQRVFFFFVKEGEEKHADLFFQLCNIRIQEIQNIINQLNNEKLQRSGRFSLRLAISSLLLGIFSIIYSYYGSELLNEQQKKQFDSINNVCQKQQIYLQSTLNTLTFKIDSLQRAVEAIHFDTISTPALIKKQR